MWTTFFFTTVIVFMIQKILYSKIKIFDFQSWLYLSNKAIIQYKHTVTCTKWKWVILTVLFSSKNSLKIVKKFGAQEMAHCLAHCLAHFLVQLALNSPRCQVPLLPVLQAPNHLTFQTPSAFPTKTPTYKQSTMPSTFPSLAPIYTPSTKSRSEPRSKPTSTPSKMPSAYPT